MVKLFFSTVSKKHIYISIVLFFSAEKLHHKPNKMPQTLEKKRNGISLLVFIFLALTMAVIAIGIAAYALSIAKVSNIKYQTQCTLTFIRTYSDICQH